jgi:hypothetical protein
VASVRVVYRMSFYRHQIDELLISPLFNIENLVLMVSQSSMDLPIEEV